MKQFKAFAGDYEYLLTLSDQGELYCLTEQQVYAIEVQLEYIGWLTRWYNTDDITQTTVDRLKSDIAEALMSCVDVQILVDQAEANLVTDVTNRAIQSQTLRKVYSDRYTGVPTSINANAPTTTFSYSNTALGDEALCAALMAFIYQFARAQADSVRAGQIGGLAAIALIAFLLIPGLNIFFVVGAAIAVLAGLGTIGVTTETAISALTDMTALDAVVCCMKDKIKNQAVSQANWNAALSTCGFAGGSNSAIVRDFVNATLATNYLTFLDMIGTAYVGAVGNSEMPACPCSDPPPDPACADLATGQEQWYILNGIGIYTANVGFVPELISGAYYMTLRRTQDAVARTIVEVELKFNNTPAPIKFISPNGVTLNITATGPTIIINETTYPTLVPFVTAGGGQIGIEGAGVNGLVSSGGATLVLYEVCLRV